jgi:insulysin
MYNMDNLNKFQYFDIYQAINDKRDIRGLILNNGIKIVLVSDKTIITSACSIAVNAGYLEDEYEGTAHFLEHLLFMGSEKFPSQNEYHSYVSVCGGIDNAYTADNITCYYLEIESLFLKKGIEMLSWFFRKPLLDMNLIKSEMEIINSEHDKNILSDSWIMDDILKKLIKPSKYTNFGTGSNESLKNIKKDDILKYYNKYYTTDNMYICIVDSKTIDEMINEYIIYFNEIKETKMSKDNTVDNIKLVEENLIVYKSISKYNFFNVMLFIDCVRKNEEQYIIINFINYLLSVEYIDSLSYYLKENNLVKNIHIGINYFFDDKALIDVKFILIDENINKLNEVYCQFYTYLEVIKNISEYHFKMIYNDYQKTRLLDSMYSDNSISTSDTSNNIIDNMINGKLEHSILRRNYVDSYDISKYNMFKKMINSIIIKLSTNININKNNNFIKSKWYNTSYHLSNYNNINLKKIDKINNFNYKIENIIGIKNFVINEFINLKKINKKEIPLLIYKKDNKEIYLLENNKYEKPICTINVIKRNKKLLNKYNNIIMSIYFSLCDKILNYYLEVMSMYYCNFTIQMHHEFLIHNYTGLDYILTDKFINEINRMINIDIIFSNENFEKYFLQIKRDYIENLKNSIYESSYLLCLSYLQHTIKNTLFPKEKIDFIENLTIDNFKKILIDECLIYDYEYYIIIGIKKNNNIKNINNINNINNIKYNFNEDVNLKNIIDLISINETKFYKKSIEYNLEKNNNTANYIFKKDDFNSKDEKNNCIIQYSIIYNKKFLTLDNNYNEKFVYSLIKNKLIASITSQILNEPLFDRIRTIDKLGYIVKCNYMHIYKYDSFSIILFYLIQSQYDIKKINKSIDDFNKFMLNDIKKNKDMYLEKFNSLKKSKLLELKKPFTNLLQEIGSYIDSIVNKIYILNINDLIYKICKKIKFTEILSLLKKFLENKSEKYNIILDSKN